MTIAVRSVTNTDYLIGRRIAALREARGLSQSALAQALGLSFQQIQKYEYGKNRISVARLLLIADVIDVPYNELMDVKKEISANKLASLRAYDAEAVEISLIFAEITDVNIRNNLLSIVRSAAMLQKSSIETNISK